ncbi:glycosyltransferase family 4 protein [Candidatus Nomurabacteria bacterium]|nr:MAG: glycosyltransferase family 4 protein [Candidatus Nomurabacteria bacterium]
MNRKSILIATGIYPPEIGGPAQYAFNLNEGFRSRGHRVKVSSFTWERNMPSLIRHICFFIKILPKVLWADRVILLDAVSVGFPTAIACFVFNKKFFIRIGGDFLWEYHIEHTGQNITLESFYDKNDFSVKENIIKGLTKYTLKKSTKVVVNSMWFGNFLLKNYKIPDFKIVLIENYFSGVNDCGISQNKKIILSSRKIKLKNNAMFTQAVAEVSKEGVGVEIFDKISTHQDIQEQIKTSYAVAAPSFSEVNPNIVLEGISFGKPFILTRHTGLNIRFMNMGILIEPFNLDSIKDGITKICDPKIYSSLRENILNCRYINTWEDIITDFERIIL